MNYYLDTEFIETPGSIELISIGITDEKGNDFYMISSEFDESKANDWVKTNVINKLGNKERHTKAEIKQKLIEYIEYTSNIKYFHKEGEQSRFMKRGKEQDENHYIDLVKGDIDWWAYYADYDWVVFCWLFGTMMDLPKGMPMYCKDLKQEMDHAEFPDNLKPKQGNEHHALDDAKWNRALHNTLIAFEMQKREKDMHKEYEALRDEIEIALAEFQRKYNEQNPDSKINIGLNFNQQKTDIEEGFVGRASISLVLRYEGSSHNLANHVFKHRTKEEYAAKFDWALKIYRDMLQDIVGSAMTLQILTIENQKREQEEIQKQLNAKF